MPVVRVYLPVGPVDLAALAERGSLPATPDSTRVVFAVTPELERSTPGLDVEDLEYAAFSDAVVAAGAAVRGAAHRRVVIAADVDPDWLVESETQPYDSVCAVTLAAAVPRARVAAFHIDERPVPGAGSAADADTLLWYDATELDEVRAFFA